MFLIAQAAVLGGALQVSPAPRANLSTTWLYFAGTCWQTYYPI